MDELIESVTKDLAKEDSFDDDAMELVEQAIKKAKEIEDVEPAKLAAVEVTSTFNDLVQKTYDHPAMKDFQKDPGTIIPLNQKDIISDCLSMATPEPMPFLSGDAYLCHFTEESMSPSRFFPPEAPFSKLSNEEFKTMVIRGILVFPSSSILLHKKLVDFCFYKLSVTEDQQFGQALGRYLAREMMPIELSYSLFATILANWGLQELSQYTPKPPCPPGSRDRKALPQEHNLLVLPFIACCADNFDPPHASAMLTYLMQLFFDPILLCQSIYVFKPISKLIEVLCKNGTEVEFFMDWNLEGIPPKNFFYLLNILESSFARKKADLLLKLGYKFVCQFFSQEYNPSIDVTVSALCKTFVLGHDQLFGGKMSIMCILLYIYDYLIQMIPPADSDYKPMQEFMTALRHLGSEYGYEVDSCYYKERVQHFTEFWRLRLVPFNESVDFHFRVKLFNPSTDYLGEGEN